MLTQPGNVENVGNIDVANYSDGELFWNEGNFLSDNYYDGSENNEEHDYRNFSDDNKDDDGSDENGDGRDDDDYDGSSDDNRDENNASGISQGPDYRDSLTHLPLYPSHHRVSYNEEDADKDECESIASAHDEGCDYVDENYSHGVQIAYKAVQIGINASDQTKFREKIQ